MNTLKSIVLRDKKEKKCLLGNPQADFEVKKYQAHEKVTSQNNISVMIQEIQFSGIVTNKYMFIIFGIDFVFLHTKHDFSRLHIYYYYS